MGREHSSRTDSLEHTMLSTYTVVLVLLLAGITFQPGQVSGEVDCCKTVRFDSTGPLAESMYAFMIGTYEYVADDAGGNTGVRGIYRCTDCSYELELYYNPPGNAFGRWHIGFGPETTEYGAVNMGGEICPEDLTDWETVINGEWITEPEIKVTCQ